MKYFVALIALVSSGLLLPSSGQAFADHGGPHEPDTIVVGVRPSCPDGYICLTGEDAREFRRQLLELAVQAALLAELARELPQAPEDGEAQVSCHGLKAEFKKLFDQCMRDADKGWAIARSPGPGR
ncbi:MAG: hypothetical protein OXU77_08535 [Gammaproteobacteria bacterium]|nr:hypothetical protein [Gammaproteobacteria bacterium]MDE0444163.1 hypothetical protein [Gammaproteobacteria bacterium]